MDDHNPPPDRGAGSGGYFMGGALIRVGRAAGQNAEEEGNKDWSQQVWHGRSWREIRMAVRLQQHRRPCGSPGLDDVNEVPANPDIESPDRDIE